MNIYKAQKDQIVRTLKDKRVQIRAGQEFCGGLDSKNDRVVLFTEVNGEHDNVVLNTGQEFMDNFRFLWHTDIYRWEKVEIVKRKRISK